ncbi:MAG: hypothetical protein ABFD96_04735, partial [Armatimonadia bacterium]
MSFLRQGFASLVEGFASLVEGVFEGMSSCRRCCRLLSDSASLSLSPFKISLGGLGIITTGSGNSAGGVDDGLAVGVSHALSAITLIAVVTNRIHGLLVGMLHL